MKVGILHTAFIGDVVLVGLLVEALYEGGHSVVFFTKSKTADIFKHDIRVKKVISIEKPQGLWRKALAVLRTGACIRQEGLDVLLVPHRSVTSTLCAFFSQTPKTVGFLSAGLSFLYRYRAAYDKGLHECLRYLALLQAAPFLVEEGRYERLARQGRPVLRYSPAACEAFAAKCSQIKLLTAYRDVQGEPGWAPMGGVLGNFFVLSVGSVWPTKKYPLESWAKVVFLFLQAHPHVSCLLTGGPEDEAAALSVQAQCALLCEQAGVDKSLLSRLLLATSRFSLAEFALLIGQARFVLSNDSAPVHLAAAFDVPTLAVFGPTVPAFGFGPTSSRHVVVTYRDPAGQSLPCQPCTPHGSKSCPKGHFLCMQGLTPQTVYNVLEVFIKTSIN